MIHLLRHREALRHRRSMKSKDSGRADFEISGLDRPKGVPSCGTTIWRQYRQRLSRYKQELEC
jgi:hypothetical protein